MIRLSVSRESGESAVYEFNQEDVLIGRAPPADVLLDNEAVSRRHARISRKNGAWRVADLGAANGVFVQRKGNPPAQRVIVDPLDHGDVICIERYRVSFEIHEGHSAPPRAPRSPHVEYDDNPTDISGLPTLKAVKAATGQDTQDVESAGAPGSKGLFTPGAPVSLKSRKPATPQDPVLEVYLDDQKAPTQLSVGRTPVYFGSDPSCEVKLTGLGMPRFVCSVENREGRLIVKRVPNALGPRMSVGGSPAEGEQPLQTGQKLMIGHVCVIARDAH